MTRRDLACLTSEKKDALILALFDRIAALEAKLAERDRGGAGPAGPAKTPGNSSLPPSRGQKTNKPPRPKGPRKKRDGPGISRRLADAPDRVVDCLADSCTRCGRAIGADGQGVRQSYDHIDLPPIRPVVTRVRIWGRRCPGCRRRVRGTPPADMPPGTPFGPGIRALLAYLHHQHAVGYQRLAGLMGEVFGLAISEGAIAGGLRRAGTALVPVGTAIRDRLRHARVIGCDETGARLTTEADGTRMAWEWVLVSDRAVLHRIEPSRGRAVIEDVLGAHRPRVWVSDRWSAQQGHADDHQVCLAHVARDVQYAIDAGEPVFAPRRSGDVRKTYASIAKMKRMLGVRKTVGFSEGMEKTLAWFRTK